VPEDVRFCDECKAERTPQADDGVRQHTSGYNEELDELRKSSRWQRVRASVLRAHPFCARCERAVAEICDHIVPAAIAVMQAQESKRYPYDKCAGYYLKTNLQGLCRSCHGVKTLEDKCHVGPWPNVVETEDKAPKKVWTF
jgi:5-methylcytosine-specific restriction endonuclease McrA